jgi:hypothetical protein
MMHLVRDANSTYNEVNTHLKVLREENIIFDEHLGRLRVIRLVTENPRTQILLEALRILKPVEATSCSKSSHPSTRQNLTSQNK